jgi:hypothetical protein
MNAPDLIVPETRATERTPGGLLLPEGVGLGEALGGLPGAQRDPVPTAPKIENIDPRDYAKPSCKWCNGQGHVGTANGAVRQLCQCVHKRVNSRKGPRRPRQRHITTKAEA